MTRPLTIVARIEAKQDHIELVKSEALKLLAPTRKEQGCLQYQLQQDNSRPEILIFYENWKDQEAFQAHIKSEHLKVFLEITDNAIENLTIHEMTQIDSE